jgi:tetratricopeptide (TPR) repeat protein
MIEQRKKESEAMLVASSSRKKELNALEEKADKERRQGDFDQALATLARVLTIRNKTLDQLKKAGMDTSAEVAATVRVLHTMGFTYAEKGDEENAHRLHSDAVKLYRKHKGPKKTNNEKPPPKVEKGRLSL